MDDQPRDPLEVFQEAREQVSGLKQQPESESVDSPSADSSPVVQSESSPSQTPILDRWRERGDVDVTRFQTDDEFVNELEGMVNRQGQQAQQMEKDYWEYRRLQEDPAFQEWQQSRTAPAEPTEPVEPASILDWGPAPEIQQQWLGWVERAPNGALRLTEEAQGNADPAIPGRVQEYLDWQADRQDKIYNDFEGLTAKVSQAQFDQYLKSLDPDGLESYIEKRVSQVLEQREQVKTAENEWQGFLDEHDDLFYKKDESGKPLVDGDGYKVLTDEGRKVGELAQRAQELFARTGGTASLADIKQYVTDAWHPPAPASDSGPETPESKPAAAPEIPLESRSTRLKEAFEKEPPASGVKNGNRRVAKAAERDSQNVDLGEMLREDFRANGLVD